MKVASSSCVALAAALTARYHAPLPSTQPASTGSLTDHGILLTMCIGGCALGLEPDHVSASWIHASTGADRVIPVTNVGFVLNPSVVQINCLYPTDGGTDGRTGNGCGPIKQDPRGLGPLAKFRIRKGTKQYKEFNWPGIAWEDVPCRFFLNMPRPIKDCLTWDTSPEPAALRAAPTSRQTDNVTVEPCRDTFARYFQDIMGHPICQLEDTTTVSKNDTVGLLLSATPTPWQPNEWQEVLRLQHYFIESYPNALLWNEIVLARPKHNMADIVQAVLVYPDRPSALWSLQDARIEASLLGKNVPVILVKRRAFNESVEFRCADDNEDNSDDDYFGFLTKNNGDSSWSSSSSFKMS